MQNTRERSVSSEFDEYASERELYTKLHKLAYSPRASLTRSSGSEMVVDVMSSMLYDEE
jgi:hypothetical protein